MRIATLLLTLLLAGPALASPEADARAALALALAQASQPPSPAKLTYQEACAEVKRTGKPMVTWVNCDCPPCRASLADCVHVHVGNLEGDSTPRCVVGIVNAQGIIMAAGDLRGPWSAALIRQRIAETRREVQVGDMPKPAAPVLTPQQPRFDMPSAPMMRGGSRSC